MQPRHRLSCLILGSAVLLIAAQPDWKTKPIAAWTEEDARQILAYSPWAKTVVAGIARRQTEDERRQGGDMGQPHGVGYDGIDDKKAGGALPANHSGGDEIVVRSRTQGLPLTVRWESALPIRAAEIKAHVPEPPTLSDDGYSIAVYGVPATYINGDPATLGNPLKSLAALKREGKRDVKPSSAEVFELDGSVVVVYLFPLSAEISKRDGVVEFSALIGRLQVSQNFLIEEMQFQGKLHL